METTMTAGLEGVIAGESEICYIDGYQGILSYRGYNIHTLAEHAVFEEVIFLLWNGWLPKQAELDQLRKDLVAARGLPRPLIEFLRGGNQRHWPSERRRGIRCKLHAGSAGRTRF